MIIKEVLDVLSCPIKDVPKYLESQHSYVREIAKKRMEDESYEVIRLEELETLIQSIPVEDVISGLEEEERQVDNDIKSEAGDLMWVSLCPQKELPKYLGHDWKVIRDIAKDRLSNPEDDKAP